MFKSNRHQTSNTISSILLNNLQLNQIRGGIECGNKTEIEIVTPILDLTKPVIDPVTGLPVIPKSGK